MPRQCNSCGKWARCVAMEFKSTYTPEAWGLCCTCARLLSEEWGSAEAQVQKRCRHCPTANSDKLPLRVLYPKRKWYAEEDLPSGLVIVPRQEWGAKEPECNPLFDQLTPLRNLAIRVNFNCTGSKTCYNKKDCCELLKSVQENYMDCGYADITHNFMIGADGRVYEGRGWTTRPDHIWGTNRDKCLDIAFVGFFMEAYPLPIQVATAFKLLDYGIKCRKISPRFRETWFRDEKFPGPGERRKKGIMGRKIPPKVTRLRDIYDEYDVYFA